MKTLTVYVVGLLGLLLLVATPAFAQSTAQVAWTQPEAPSIASTFTYTFKDLASTGVAVPPTCIAATAPATGSACKGPIPVPLPGPHSFTLTASNNLGAATSAPLTGNSPNAPGGISVSVTVTVTGP